MTVSDSNSSLLSSSVPNPSNGCITVSRNKPLKKLETQKTPAKINSWVDSMRSSSPTRTRPSTTDSVSESVDEKKWMTEHPSALTMFDEIAKSSKGKQIVVFLDYDGTLSPIVANPEKAYMTNEMREAVKHVSRNFPTAIVTGRCIDKVRSFVKLSGLYYAGSHGMDIKGPTKKNKFNKDNQAVHFQAGSEFLPMISQVNKLLIEKTKSIPGATVENNKFCVSVHYRNVNEKKWPVLAEQVKSVLNVYPKLRLSQGRKVLEIRPTIKWDKGKAIEFLLKSLGFGNSKDVLPIYIGDDRTDEDAFKVLRDRDQGFGILVSKVSKKTHASYTLQEPDEVKCFLKHLVEWKQL